MNSSPEIQEFGLIIGPLAQEVLGRFNIQEAIRDRISQVDTLPGKTEWDRWAETRPLQRAIDSFCSNENEVLVQNPAQILVDSEVKTAPESEQKASSVIHPDLDTPLYRRTVAENKDQYEAIVAVSPPDEIQTLAEINKTGVDQLQGALFGLTALFSKISSKPGYKWLKRGIAGASVLIFGVSCYLGLSQEKPDVVLPEQPLADNATKAAFESTKIAKPADTGVPAGRAPTRQKFETSTREVEPTETKAPEPQVTPTVEGVTAPGKILEIGGQTLQYVKREVTELAKLINFSEKKWEVVYGVDEEEEGVVTCFIGQESGLQVAFLGQGPAGFEWNAENNLWLSKDGKQVFLPDVIMPGGWNPDTQKAGASFWGEFVFTVWDKEGDAFRNIVILSPEAAQNMAETEAKDLEIWRDSEGNITGGLWFGSPRTIILEEGQTAKRDSETGTLTIFDSEGKPVKEMITKWTEIREETDVERMGDLKPIIEPTPEPTKEPTPTPEPEEEIVLAPEVEVNEGFSVTVYGSALKEKSLDTVIRPGYVVVLISEQGDMVKVKNKFPNGNLSPEFWMTKEDYLNLMSQGIIPVTSEPGTPVPPVTPGGEQPPTQQPEQPVIPASNIDYSRHFENQQYLTGEWGRDGAITSIGIDPSGVEGF